jgi:hypothetical protein
LYELHRARKSRGLPKEGILILTRVRCRTGV